MINFFKSNQDKAVIKSINLDDFSIEDLENYILELSLEVKRAELEIKKRLKTKEVAQNFFK